MNTRSLYSIRSKIAGSFLLLVVIACSTGFFAMSRLSHVAEESANVAAGEFKAIQRLGQMATLSQRISNGIMLSQFSFTAASKKEILTEIPALISLFSKSWADYASMIQPGEEASLSEDLAKAWQHFLTVQEEVIALDRAGEWELARKVLMNDLNIDNTLLYAAVSKVQEFRQNKIDEALAYAESERENRGAMDHCCHEHSSALLHPARCASCHQHLEAYCPDDQCHGAAG